MAIKEDWVLNVWRRKPKIENQKSSKLNPQNPSFSSICVLLQISQANIKILDQKCSAKKLSAGKYQLIGV